MKQIEVMLYGMLERVPFIEKDTLLKMDVRYIGTDGQLSHMDIYEDKATGDLYATEL